MTHKDSATLAILAFGFLYVIAMVILDIRQGKRKKNKQKIGDKVLGTPPVVTLQMLKDLDACDEYTMRFRTIFGDSTPVTEDICVTNAENWYWSWASDRMLTAPGQTDYHVAALAAETVKSRLVRKAYSDFLEVEKTPYVSSQEVANADKIYHGLRVEFTRKEQEALARAFAYAANTYGLR